MITRVEKGCFVRLLLAAGYGAPTDQTTRSLHQTQEAGMEVEGD